MKITNPIIKGQWADPYVLKDGDDYYLYPTKDSEGWIYEKFHVFHSRDLVNWSEPTLALDLDDIEWATAHAWAPSIAKFNNKYYMYFCADQQIGLAVSDSPLGPFSDLLGKPLIKKAEYQCQSIDPDIFIDDDGQPYLLWGQGKCWIVPLEEDMYTFKSEPYLLSDQMYEQLGKDKKQFDISVYNEGSHMQKINNEYLLTWTIYDTRDPRYQVCYAKSKSILGPYQVSEENQLIKRTSEILGTGHASMTEYKNKWYLLYHRLIDYETSTLREVCCSPIEFNAGEPFVLLEDE